MAENENTTPRINSLNNKEKGFSKNSSMINVLVNKSNQKPPLTPKKSFLLVVNCIRLPNYSFTNDYKHLQTKLNK